MRPQGSTDELEARRLEAVRLVKEEGLTRTEAGRRVGAHRNSVTIWVELFDRGGPEALACDPPGQAPKLDDAQRGDIVRCVLEGPEAHGFDNQLWTLPRIAKLIARRHGVRYDADHLSRLLRSWGLSWQKPRKKPLERDDGLIARWLRRDWPRIKKK